MPTASKSLNQFVHFTRVLPAIGVSGPSSAVLPATVTCPFCHQATLRILDDTVVGGQWAYCGQCRFAGDLIELAAKAWGTDVPTALTRLHGLGLLDGSLSQDRAASYLRDHVDYRRRLRDFWTEAQVRPNRGCEYSVWQLIEHFGMRDQASYSGWLAQSGRFVGAAKCTDIQNLFHPGSYAVQMRSNRGGKTSLRRGGGPGPGRLFRGEGWDDALVIPCQDLPGRICGFLFIGRKGDPKAGDIFYKAANLQPSSVPFREAGLGMLDALEDGTVEPFGDAVFVFGDPLIGLHLQGRTFKMHPQTLPIVLSFYGPGVRTQAAWTQLSERKLIFWGDDVPVLKQARAAGGMVSSYPLPIQDPVRGFSHHPTQEWLRLIATHAVSWQIALQRRLEQSNQTAAEALLQEMDFPPEELRHFVLQCPPALGERLRHSNPDRFSQRQLKIDGKTVRESKAGWTLYPSGELIADAPVRVEEILESSAGARYYRGVVSIGQELHRFTLPAGLVERRGLFPCVRDSLLAQGKGVFTFHPRWSKRSLFMATQFSRPRLVTAIDRIGWNSAHRAFLFPQFAICYGGEVRRDLLPVVSDGPVPAAELDYQDWLSPGDRIALSDPRPEAQIAWAVTACVIHNLLQAPGLFPSCTGILLDGPGAQATGLAVAKALGCIELAPRRRGSGQTLLGRIAELGLRHDWPVVVPTDVTRSQKVTAEWAESPGIRNSVLALNRLATLAMAINPGFEVVSWDEPAAPLLDIRQALASLVPAYLADLLKRRLRFHVDAISPIRTVLLDMAQWFESQGGDPAAVRRAERLFLTRGRDLPVTVFSHLLSHMLDTGLLNIVPAGFEGDGTVQPAIVARPASPDAPAALWVPMRGLNRLLGLHHAPAIDTARVTKALQGEEGFLGIEQRREEEGWLLSEEWWRNHCLGRRRACSGQSPATPSSPEPRPDGLSPVEAC